MQLLFRQRTRLSFILPRVFFAARVQGMTLLEATRLAELSVRASKVGTHGWNACWVCRGVWIVMPADRERGALVLRIRGDGAERGAQSGPQIHRPREDWPLSPWSFLGGALAGGSAAIWGAARASCAPVGPTPGAFTTDAAFSVAGRSLSSALRQRWWWLSLGRILR